MRQLFFVIVFICNLTLLIGQKTVSGIVTDSSNNEPVPFANVFVKNTGIGTVTGLDGKFLFKIQNQDSVTISAVGYLSRSVSVVKDFQDMKISLHPDVVEISEVNVKPSNERVMWILYQSIDNKKINNPEKYDRYNYEKYSKWDYNLNNVEKSLMKSNVFKNHQSLFQKSEDGTVYLPVYFSEQVVKNEFQRNPRKEKSTIIADKTSGLGVLDSYEFAGYTSGLEVSQNYYDNYIKLYEQNFVSPLASNGKFYYRYYLVDSAMVDGVKQFKIDFYPRRKGENVFKGYMMIDEDRFALRKIEAKLSEGSQLNFIHSLAIDCEYQLVDDTIIFYKNNLLKADFDYFPTGSDSAKKRLELTFTEFSSFDKVEINPDDDIELSSKSLNYESVKSLGYDKKNADYWNSLRHVELTPLDKEKYAVIDSVNQIKTVKIANDLVQMGLNGYLDLGKFEIGPYTDFIQTNKIEGVRLYFGGRTSSEISENWMFYGGASYGFRNKHWSGLGGVGYKFNNTKRKVFKLEYDDRYTRMGENRKILYLYENMLSPSETNLVSSIFSRDELDELYRQQGIHLSYENEWRTGFSTTFNLNYKKQYSPEYYPFILNGDGVDYLQAYEAGLNFRFSWKETVIDDGFMRLYVSTDYPIINFSVVAGQVQYNDVQDEYVKLHATLKGKKYFGQMYFNYAFEAGKIFGDLPYTMLEIPRGNETYGYYTYDFNMINYLEFIHDEYIHSYLEYHLNGFFMNRLPLFRRLGLREVVSAKAMYGTLSDSQKKGIDLPEGALTAENGYLEVGVGLENVLRFFRIEGVWRVQPVSKIGAPSFGLRAKFEIKL